LLIFSLMIGGGTPGGRSAIVNESIVNESIVIALFYHGV